MVHIVDHVDLLLVGCVAFCQLFIRLVYFEYINYYTCPSRYLLSNFNMYAINVLIPFPMFINQVLKFMYLAFLLYLQC